jgi:hypothetical protein
MSRPNIEVLGLEKVEGKVNVGVKLEVDVGGFQKG